MSKHATLARLAILTAALLGHPAWAQTTTTQVGNSRAASIQPRLAELIAKLPKQTQVALVVADCDNGEIRFSHRPQAPMKPASVMKLFTTAVALDRFGPDFTFETRVLLKDGELLILGGGDPGLGDERLAQRHGRPVHGEFADWAAILSERGISELKTIALDDAVFDREYQHPDWPASQTSAWYQAPVGGINFNDNCLDARFTAANGQITLHLQPELPEVFIDNKLTPAEKHRPVAGRVLGRDIFEFRGPVARSDSFKAISVGNPSVFFGHALRHALERRGIKVSGQVVRRELTPERLAGAELLDIRTTSLRDVLWRCNTFSQNMFAECLFKSLSAYEPDGSRAAVAGNWNDSRRVLEAALRGFGLDPAGAVFRDGSGLSHDNRASAELIVKLLCHMQDHQHRRLFMDSLARPGRSGTLSRKRWATPALKETLRAKTGTLSGVSTLAGYVQRTDGKTLAFALLIKGQSSGTFRAQIAGVLAETGVKTQP